MNAMMHNETNDNGNFAAPYRGPIDAVRVCFAKYFDFHGRASRSEFWWFFLFMTALIYPLAKLMSGKVAAYVPMWLISISTELMWVPLIAVCARRMHDINYSGWWALLGYLPNILMYLIWFVSAIVISIVTSTPSPVELPVGLPHIGLLPPAPVTPSTLLAVFVLSPKYFWYPQFPALLVLLGFLFVFVLSAKKGKREQNRFDRGAESFGFSFNRPAMRDDTLT